jgi:phosphopantothenoylcysteine synthetase/decarboxylase
MEKTMKSMRNIKIGALAVVLAAALSWPVYVYAKEEKVKLVDCPEAVQKTIKGNANGGRIVEIEKETKKDGTVVYEAEVKKADGKEIELVVAADGTLLKVEEEDDDDDDGDDDDKEDDDD